MITEKELKIYCFTEYASHRPFPVTNSKNLELIKREINQTQMNHVARQLHLSVSKVDLELIKSLPHTRINKKKHQKNKTKATNIMTRTLVEAYYSAFTKVHWMRLFINYRANATDLGFQVASLIWDAIGLGAKAGLCMQYRTSSVMALLNAMRVSEDFTYFPILADALQDTGFENDGLLAHYRDPNAMFSLGSWIFRATGML